MTRVIAITVFLLLVTIHYSSAKEAVIPLENQEQSINSIEEQEDLQNEQINTDEGYGSNDEEYYNSEVKDPSKQGI